VVGVVEGKSCGVLGVARQDLEAARFGMAEPETLRMVHSLFEKVDAHHSPPDCAFPLVSVRVWDVTPTADGAAAVQTLERDVS
jgi:hypothetical protein